MAAVTKRDFVVQISYKLQVKQFVVRDVLDQFLDRVVESLGEGRRIELRNFGVFEVVQRKAKKGRNPKTGEVVPIPARKAVKFTSGRIMKQKVR
ncbi:integration host factor subunit beta [bacterium]|nr:integration host factor subunit beta [bacterium]